MKAKEVTKNYPHLFHSHTVTGLCIIASLVLTKVRASHGAALLLLVPGSDVPKVSTMSATLTPHEHAFDNLMTDGTQVGQRSAALAVPRTAGSTQRLVARGAVREIRRRVHAEVADGLKWTLPDYLTI